MTIPRQIGPESGLRAALPDYSRSNATVERMVSDLRRPSRSRASTGRGDVRVLVPRAAVRDTLLRAVISAMALGTSAMLAVTIVILWLTIEDGHSPRIGLLLIMLALAAAGAITALVGLRFAVVAVGTARSRVEMTDEGPCVVGAFRARTVPWRQILAVESRVIHPVHWLTAALRLQDGSRVVMPAFDRHVWTYAQPSGQDIRTLRTEVRRREQAARRRPS